MVKVVVIEDDKDHAKVLSQTGFWGNQGAGCIVYALDSKKYLIVKRSVDVLEPLTWGTVGGAIDSNEDPKHASIRELKEETGCNQQIIRSLLVYIYEKTNFKYYNYIHVIRHQFTPKLNWENIDFCWLTKDELSVRISKPDTHFGLKSLLSNGKLLENNEVSQIITDFEEKINNEYKNIIFDIYYNKGTKFSGSYIKVNNIIIPKENRQNGVGTSILQRLISLADSLNITIYLEPAQKDPHHGTTSRSRLIRFYKRLGFVENKGRNKDFSFFGGMIKKPK
jgi:8-oxo-dGTP pyrophosphatase MutT (NUDIX family)